MCLNKVITLTNPHTAQQAGNVSVQESDSKGQWSEIQDFQLT